MRRREKIKPNLVDHSSISDTGELKREYRDKVTDYPTSARSMALRLDEFCDESLPYPAMIAFAAYQASEEIKMLRDSISKLNSLYKERISL